MLPGPLVLSLLLAAAPKAPAAPAPQAAWEDLAVDLLRQYLQIDTTVPPGNELKAALFFKKALEAEGITAEIDEFAPGRANVLAILKGNGKKRALILSNHMDVVPADATRWSVPPFSGLAKDGFIWGRGAEDMKTEGILQLLAVLRLKRENVALDRDVIFLGTADEEVDYLGALRVLENASWRERLQKAEFFITEGGENIADASGRPRFFGVDTGEKGPFWLKLRTEGRPGHGSRPIADSALNRLVRALERVRLHQTSFKVLPLVQKFFRDQAATLEGERAEWYRDLAKAMKDPAAARTLGQDREVAPLIRNTISITVVHAGYKTNVIPGTAEAELDVRLLPGEDPQAFLAELRTVIDDPTVQIDAGKAFRPPNASSIDSDLFHTVERVLGRHYPGVPVTSQMLTGATESVLFRPLGIQAYGFTPLVTSADEVSTAHGDDERINEATVRRSAGIFFEVVRELCGTPGSAP